MSMKDTLVLLKEEREEVRKKLKEKNKELKPLRDCLTKLTRKIASYEFKLRNK